MQALHVRDARARRRRALAIFAVAFAVTTAELCWWVTFNVRATHAQRQAADATLARDCALAQALLDGRSEVPWRALFPLLELADDGARVVPRAEVARAVAGAHDAHVRMFLAEGAFFLLMVAVGGGLIFRIMRLEVGVLRQQANFLNAITHELKSPLAAMRLYIETLQHRRVDPETLARYVATLRAECDRLETLVSHVLLLARIESADVADEASADDLDISAMARELCAEAAQGAPAAPRACIVAAGCPQDGPIWAQIDAASFRTIAQNLISNALKYGGGKAPAQVCCDYYRGAARLRVRDFGIGLVAREQARVFEAFYRVGDEMVRQNAGSGLGLYLVRALARAHRGEVQLHSDGVNQGCEVTVTLPASSAAGRLRAAA